MTRKEIRDTIRENLADAAITYYSDAEINSVIQDAYNEICAKSQCLLKRSTQNWISNANYYDFVTLGVTDYLGTVAIFNNNTNWWLRDDISIRDFSRIRRDWEIWNGQPQCWASHSLQYIAIAPKLATATGTFVLHYYANAPTLSSDSSVPLIATDVQRLFEFYCTGTLLETAEETTKASIYFSKYYPLLAQYKRRCHEIAKAELLLRI